MRIVVQNKENHLFWKKQADWSVNPNEAHDFETATQAEKFCREAELNQAQIVIKFESIKDVVLQVVHFPKGLAN